MCEANFTFFSIKKTAAEGIKRRFYFNFFSLYICCCCWCFLHFVRLYVKWVSPRRLHCYCFHRRHHCHRRRHRRSCRCRRQYQSKKAHTEEAITKQTVKSEKKVTRQKHTVKSTTTTKYIYISIRVNWKKEREFLFRLSVCACGCVCKKKKKQQRQRRRRTSQPFNQVNAEWQNCKVKNIEKKLYKERRSNAVQKKWSWENFQAKKFRKKYGGE